MHKDIFIAVAVNKVHFTEMIYIVVTLSCLSVSKSSVGWKYLQSTSKHTVFVDNKSWTACTDGHHTSNWQSLAAYFGEKIQQPDKSWVIKNSN